MDGDIESNPGPKAKTKKEFFISCYHWNVNSLLPIINCHAGGYTTLLHKYDVICISESYLDSTFPLDDYCLFLNGYITLP